MILFLLAGLALGYAEQVRRSTINKLPLPPVTTHRRGSFWSAGRLFSRVRIHGSSADATPNARKTVRTITFQVLCWGLTGPIMLPVTALLTRYLGPVQYGEYGFTFPFLAICALLSGTGMDPLIIRLLSRLPRTEWSETLSYAAGSRCLLTTVSVATLSLLVLMLPFSTEQRYLLLFGCFSLFFNFSYNGLRVIYSHGFRAEQRVTLLILLETGDRLLTAAMVIVVVLFRLPLLWAYILIIYVDLPCCIVLMLIARHRFGIHMRLSFHHLRIRLLESLALTGYDALALLTGQADIILLMLFTGPLNVGLYALAIRISDPLLSVAYMYVNGIYPLLCSTFEKRHAQFATFYKEAIRIISLAIIPPSIFVSIQADTVVSLLGGQHFAAAAIVVQLLMWATAIIFYSQLAVRSCMAADMERWIPYVAGAAAVLNLLGNFVLIPLWQAVGAAIASLVSEMLALLLFMLLLKRHIQLLPTLGVVLQVVLGNALMLAFLFWQRHTSLLLTAPIALLLSIIGCFATRVLSWRDLQMVRRFLFTSHLNSSIETTAEAEHPSLSVVPLTPGSLDVVEYRAPLLSQFQDITDCPTLILPRIRV